MVSFDESDESWKARAPHGKGKCMVYLIEKKKRRGLSPLYIVEMTLMTCALACFAILIWNGYSASVQKTRELETRREMQIMLHSAKVREANSNAAEVSTADAFTVKTIAADASAADVATAGAREADAGAADLVAANAIEADAGAAEAIVADAGAVDVIRVKVIEMRAVEVEAEPEGEEAPAQLEWSYADELAAAFGIPGFAPVNSGAKVLTENMPVVRDVPLERSVFPVSYMEAALTVDPDVTGILET